jgi:16S rRNA (guanine527-N7)-methyltransferase
LGRRRGKPGGQRTGAEAFAATFAVSRETLSRLGRYAELLATWQRAVNLVAAASLEDVWQRHFADSAQLVALAPDAQRWLDLGSGAGFPGLVVAIVLADLAPAAAGSPRRVTLIESDRRKAAFLREVARHTGLGDGRGRAGVAVDILAERIETVATQATLAAPDVVMARALAPLDRLLGLAAPFFASATVGLFPKGRTAAEEIAAARKLWTFEWDLVPSRTEAGGRIAVIRRLERQPKE